MNSSKVIEISKSSLIGLKAELLKKQEEVRKIKEQCQDYTKPVLKQKKKVELQKSNDGVENRNLKDVESFGEEFNILEKSREVLEKKSRLYDKLKETCDTGDEKSCYLIDFELKYKIDHTPESSNKVDEESKELTNEETYYSDSNSDLENEWVDFVDVLGRSRCCLRKDLPDMKAKDAKLATSLRPPSPPPAPHVSPELLSWDMQREMKRKKWEEQETLLLGKKDIHYQDVLFDEARPHGVGYFEFSIDENERIRQQQALKNLRNETLEQQEAVLGLRVRRQQQLQSRLAAAQRRRRERLGLPPEEPKPQEAEKALSDNEEEQEKEEKIEDLEQSIKKIASVRPWDVGKQGVAVLSQEEWVEKKRQERPQEFAPKISSSEVIVDIEPTKKKTNPNFFTTKKTKHNPQHGHQTEDQYVGSLLEGMEKTTDRTDDSSIQSPIEELCYDPLLNSHQRNTLKSKCTQVGKSYDVIFKRGRGNASESDTQCMPTSGNKKNISMENNCEKSYDPTLRNWSQTSKHIDSILSKFKTTCHSYPAPDNSKQSVLKKETTPLNNIGDHERSRQILEDLQGMPKPNNLTSAVISNLAKSESGMYEKQIKGQNSENLIRLQASKIEGFKSRPINPGKDQNSSLRTSLNGKDFSINDPPPMVSTSIKYDIIQPDIKKRKWSEIAPPASMSYYNDTIPNRRQNMTNHVQLSDSISAGLNYLKTRTEEKDKKKLKGLLDII